MTDWFWWSWFNGVGGGPVKCTVQLYYIYCRLEVDHEIDDVIQDGAGQSTNFPQWRSELIISSRLDNQLGVGKHAKLRTFNPLWSNCVSTDFIFICLLLTFGLSLRCSSGDKKASLFLSSSLSYTGTWKNHRAHKPLPNPLLFPECYCCF